MRKPFEDILHPPEVKGNQQWRYWVAVGGWFIFVLFGIAFLGGVELWYLSLLEQRYGPNAFQEFFGVDEIWLLGATLITIVSGIFFGNYFWGLLFVRTGYLSREAAIRLRTNRAPTTYGEQKNGVRLDISIARRS